MNQYFPLGLAQGSAFCNRVHERARLLQNIKSNNHSVIISPRRYGKTSLASKVIDDHKMISAKIDLLLVSNEQFAQEEILAGIGRVVSKLMPLHKKSFDTIKKYLGSLKPELSLSEEGAKITFSSKLSPRKSIAEALEQADKLAGSCKKKVVFFIDEIQQVASIEHGSQVEAAIRHAAERAKNISYVFSGSNRHLLELMFRDNTRALFQLCDEIYLARISPEDYTVHFNKFAKKTWGDVLPAETITTIFNLTKRHPRYVNLLCQRLWQFTSMPKQKKVLEIWANYCEEQRRRVSETLGRLSPNQRAVIKALAKTPTNQPSGKLMLQEYALTNASAAQALKVLRDKDLIFVDDDKVTRPLDPVVEFIWGG